MAISALLASSAGKALAGGAFDKLFGGNTTTQKQTTEYLNEDGLKRRYSEADSALDSARQTGPYSGPRYAGLTQDQLDAVGGLSTFARTNAGAPQSLIDASAGLIGTGSGYGTNAQSIFDEIMSRQPGGLEQRAMEQATGSFADSLVDSASTDALRALNEEQLPALQQAITATGNRNSSRAGAAEATTRARTADRIAQLSGDIRSRLFDKTLDHGYREQLTNDQLALGANNQLAGSFSMGSSGLREGQGLFSQLMEGQLGAGGIVQADQQNQINADRSRFDDFRYDDFDTLFRYNEALGGPVVKSTTSTYTGNEGIFTRLGSGMGGLKSGIQDAGAIAGMIPGFGG